MPNPESLLDQARTNIEAARLKHEQQKEADEKLANMYRQLAEFLEKEPGTRVTRRLPRAAMFGFSLFTIPLGVAVGKRLGFKDLRDRADNRYSQKTINGTGEPLKASAIASNASPTTLDGEIALGLEGLNEVLVLSSEADIWGRRGFVHRGAILDDSGRKVHYSNWSRKRADLSDANLWQPVVDGITGKQPPAVIDKEKSV